ncbi:SDR family NAD(P)-dependent oxidoreductase [Flammeovirga aprica]|uniref:SDR family NAD(P)-dependent oxidoreductase n=1 Tax=Flammeovirga aprica JL-4 TaxID=694437 RepID=A0A7X9P2Q2_9BACT|nr:SDR family NAD(P)-dependent oxidoreductase [Flammeovirga aprica]NME68468.1 SDR family NAD(P)-dependent oxidoreductase [Flammeovirga aprica JL-4]
MKENGIRFWKYFREYEWSNVYSMLKNNRKDPKICSSECKGKLVVITGATSGIGYLVAKKYASMGANLLCINRNLEKSEQLKAEVEEQYQVSCDFMLADLSNMKDAHSVAEKLNQMDEPIDVIIHNAGVFLTQKELTNEGIEKVLMVHHIAPFIINYKIKNKLKAQEKARIIFVNSEGHRFAPWGLRLDDLNFQKRRYSGYASYGSAKLAQLLCMLKFKSFYENSGVIINAMHPGAVKSDSGKENGKVYQWYKKNILDRNLKPATVSAEALYHLGVSEEVEKINGKFFNLTTLEEPTPPALDHEIAELLWNISKTMGRLN